MFLDITFHIRFEGNGRNAQVTLSLLEAFAGLGPAQGPRVDVPLSAAVSGSFDGVKRRVDKVPTVLAHCKRNGSRVTDWNDGQLAENRRLARKDLWQASENRIAQDPPHQGSCCSDPPKSCLNTSEDVKIYLTYLNTSKFI
jgi:hypothetical protein